MHLILSFFKKKNCPSFTLYRFMHSCFGPLSQAWQDGKHVGNMQLHHDRSVYIFSQSL